MNELTKLYIELYKRGNYEELPLFDKQMHALRLLEDDNHNEVLYGGSGRCFSGDTLVATSKGHIPISEVKAGDVILSYNIEKDEVELKKVLKKHVFHLRTPTRKVIFEDNFKCTYNHEFRFNSEWAEIGKLIGRRMETSRRSLLDLEQRKTCDGKLENDRAVKNNETGHHCGLSSNYDKREWQIQDSKDASLSCQGIYPESREKRNRKPQRLQWDKQLCREFGMDESKRECASCNCGGKRRKQIQKRAQIWERWINWRNYRYSETHRGGSTRNPKEAQAKNIHKDRFGKRVWSYRSGNKRCAESAKLEAREITKEELIKCKVVEDADPIYDLTVEDNHNYVVSKKNIIVHNSGKTWLLSVWQLMRRLAYPGSAGFIARNEYSKLQDTTLNTFYKVLKEFGLEKDVDYTVRGQHATFYFPNGSKIYFREIKYISTDPEFDRIGSYDLTDAVLDEAQQVHVKGKNVLQGRFSETNGMGWSTIPKTLYTCNPKKNWIYNDFYKPWKDKSLPKERAFIPALPSDNPYVPQSYFDNLRNADKVTRERLLYGNFEYDDDDNILVTHDAVLDMFTTDHAVTGKKTISADIAMQGRDRFIAAPWNGLNCLLSDGVDKTKSDGKEIVDDLLAMKKEHEVGNTQVVGDSDGMGAYLPGFLKNIFTFHAQSTKMSKPLRMEYKNLKSACAFKLAKLINERKIRIYCSKEQRERIIQEVSSGLKRDKIADEVKLSIIPKEKMKESIGHSPDYLDMLIMNMVFWLD